MLWDLFFQNSFKDYFPPSLSAAGVTAVLLTIPSFFLTADIKLSPSGFTINGEP